MARMMSEDSMCEMGVRRVVMARRSKAPSGTDRQTEMNVNVASNQRHVNSASSRDSFDTSPTCCTVALV